MARTVITAGLSAMMALGTSIPALASEQGASNAKGVTDTPTVGESANPSYNDQVTGESRGDTKLYIIGQQDDLTTSEGAADEQVKVSIPVAIHYVANSEGVLTGPSDNVVKFVNHTKTGPVHVSKISVDANGSVSDIAPTANVGTTNDKMGFTMQPVQGQSDDTGSVFVPATQFTNASYVDVSKDASGATVASLNGTTAGTNYDVKSTDATYSQYVQEGTVDQLGNYSVTTSGLNTKKEMLDPTVPGDWNIAQKNGALGLNKLGGVIGGFGQIDSGTDYQAGAIHWIVRSGTREQADNKDCTLTIRYNANTGERAEGATGDTALLQDQKTKILTYTASTPGHSSALAYDQATARGAQLKADSAVTAPKQVTNSDGSVKTYAFRGWSLDPKADETGATVFVPGTNFTVDDVVQAKAAGNETSLENGVLQLYAIYSNSTSSINGNQG